MALREVASYDHHAVADASIDRGAAANHDDGVGDLFITLDADVLAERDAGAGQAMGRGVLGLRGH